MKHTTKQSGRSRNKALAQRAAQLGCGISLLAVSAMLAARPARATDPAQALMDGFPGDSGTSGFVTSGSLQLNVAATVAASLNDATGSSTVDNTATGALPGTASVTGNELAAFATGSGQTNTVDLANIGTSEDFTGISILADQLNTYSNPDEGIYDPTTISSVISNSSLLNSTTNAVNGDSLGNSSNLIESQVTGNVADSSVNGVVPINYDQPEAGSATVQDAGGPDMSGAASGNVVVATSQFNTAIDGGDGSYAGSYDDDVELDVTSSGEYPQSVSVSTTESDNAISTVFLGNAATNDIGVVLNSGNATGAPTFGGSLVVANQQANDRGGYQGIFDGFGAYIYDTGIDTDIESEDSPSITLIDGAVTEDDNVISSTATGNSAVGATGGPGNEISLGVNLAGATSAVNAGNTINAEGTIISGGDLVLTNQQYQAGSDVGAYTGSTSIFADVENLVGSSVQMTGDAITASALNNNASNAIETATGAGINLISGLAALTSDQIGQSYSYADVEYADTGIFAGSGSGTLSITNSTATVTDNKLTTSAGNNQATNSIALSASTIDAGALGVASGPGSVAAASPGAEVADAGISLNNLQYSAAGTETVQYDTDIAAYFLGDTISNSSLIVTNPVLTSEATGNSGTNSITADGSQGISGSVALLNSQAQSGGVYAYLDESYEDAFGNEAAIDLQSLGENSDAGITGNSALLAGSELYAEATGNNASNTLEAIGGTLSNTGAQFGTLGLAAQLSTGLDISAQANSDLALVNSQDDFNYPAYALNQYSQAYVIADSTDGTISGSSFTVSGPANNAPTEEAVAIGNEALNALSALASTVLTDTAGLVNAQANSAGSEAVIEYNYVYAALNSYFSQDFFGSANDGGNISDTSITVGTGAAGGSNANIIRALAYGNQASNVLSVSAGTVNPDATAGSFATDGSYIENEEPFDTGFVEGPGIGAAYALLNDQIAAGTITAEGIGYNELGIYMGNTVTNPGLFDVTASLDGNALVASAFGNQAGNSATVAANNLLAETYYPAADVTNLQTNEGTLNVSLSETDFSEAPVLEVELLGDGEIQNSSLAITDNTVLTQAEGNDASSSLDTTGGNIADADGLIPGQVFSGVYNSGASSDELAFAVQNVQENDTPINADQTGTNALLSTGGAVDLSTLTADSNAFEATGYGNNAANSLDFGGTSNPVDLLDTSSGVQSMQYNDGDVNVTLGSPGVAAVAGVSPTTIGDISYSNDVSGANTGTIGGDGSLLTVVGEPIIFDVSGLTDPELTYFESVFGDEGTYFDGGYTLTAGVYNLSNTDLFGTTNGQVYNSSNGRVTDASTGSLVEPGVDGTPAVPASPSVLITVAGDITNSTLDVSNNAFDATAVANNAVNTQNIAATTVMDGGDLEGPAGDVVQADENGSLAGYVLSNDQSTESDITATANGEAGINPANTSAITGSTLIASDNTQVAEAEAEIASNTLTLTATNTTGTDEYNSATAALLSNQSSDGDVTATAGTLANPLVYGLEVTAPGAITDSTLTMDNNSSEALAVENNATNLLSADATTLADSIGGGAFALDAYEGNGESSGFTYADYALMNEQSVYDDTVTATDLTEVTNSDSTYSTSGLVGSAADLSSNSTSAFAEANAASNTLDLTSANSTASGGINNAQFSEASVQANGGGFVGFSLAGSEDPDLSAAADSAINVSKNSTTVQGIGNQATNVLNADTGATYGEQEAAYTGYGGGGAQATYAVLNYQLNSGPVAAYGSSSYGAELNGGGSDMPVSNTTVTVSYNTVDVKAFGNSATNSATVSALNSGNATVAMQNSQTNTGVITAAADDTQIGSAIGAPGASNVSVEVGNNSIVASAIGNVATNAIASH